MLLGKQASPRSAQFAQVVGPMHLPPSWLKVETTMADSGRNDPCPCGSGKKYKKCCLPKEEAAKLKAHVKDQAARAERAAALRAQLRQAKAEILAVSLEPSPTRTSSLPHPTLCIKTCWRMPDPFNCSSTSTPVLPPLREPRDAPSAASGFYPEIGWSNRPVRLGTRPGGIR
jgi:hypothetical protein